MSFQEYMFRISWWKSFGFTAFRRSVEMAWVVARIRSVMLVLCEGERGTVFFGFRKDCHMWGQDFRDAADGCCDDVEAAGGCFDNDSSKCLR